MSELGAPARTSLSRITIGVAFSQRHNSLNFLRLALALAVVVSHAILLGGFGLGQIFNKPTTLGMTAVYGFFGISGFLIAGSACRNGVGRYIWQRFLRIFPAFWVCLIVTALVFGVIASFSITDPSRPHCGFVCYANRKQGPFPYLYHNWLLVLQQFRISNTPRSVPDAGEWNGSIWTLFYEFLCYLLLALLAVLGLLRRRRVVAVLTLLVSCLTAARTINPHVFGNFGVAHLIKLYNPSYNWHTDIDVIFMKVLTFTPIFLFGALIYLYRDGIPDSGLMALACAGLYVVSLWLPLGGHVSFFSMTSADLFAPTLAYPLIWLGIHLPFQKVGARNDYSYGLYIYAYPVQQLLAVWRLQRWGYPIYLLLCIVAVAPFAVASWWMVERHALKLKTLDLRMLRSASPVLRAYSGPARPNASASAPSRKRE